MTIPLYRPQAGTLRTGDLLWVKRDDQKVYFTDPEVYARELQRIERGVHEALQSNQWSAQQRQSISQWGPDGIDSDIWVGHMAMVHIQAGQPWIIDAAPDRHQPIFPGQSDSVNPAGVATQTYAAWLSDTDHARSHVWHGRVKDLTSGQADNAVSFAQHNIGKPYRFLPWGFASGHAFYCSELVWCAVRHASGIILDDISSTLRVDWFTPWMAMKSPHIQMLFEPPGRKYGVLGRRTAQ
jgi:hypothetical protein